MLRDTLICGKCPNQGLDYSTLTTEAEYFHNFSEKQKKIN